MLIVWAVLMVGTFIVLLMSGRVSPTVVLILTPAVFGVLSGFGPELGPMMLKGMLQLTPTAVMLAFAVLYFSIMVDAGLFDPLVRLVVRLAHGDPVRVAVGTAILALTVSYDGNGASSYIICVSAMGPLYRALRMDVRGLACLLLLSSAVGHIPPWGGSTARIAAVLGVDAADVYLPLVPTMLAGSATVIAVAFIFGRAQRARRGAQEAAGGEVEGHDPTALALKRPRMFPVNLAVTIALIVGLLGNLLPLPILFIIAAGLGLQINYPGLNEQKARIAAHAPNIFKVAAFTFAAGTFLGVLQGTGMTGAMGAEAARLMPPGVGPYLALVSVVVSMPFYYLISNDVYFFSVMPVLTQAAAHYGITALEMARAAVVSVPLAMLSPIAASTYVLAALTDLEFRDLQRATFKWALLLTLVLVVTAVLTGVVPLEGKPQPVSPP